MAAKTTDAKSKVAAEMLKVADETEDAATKYAILKTAGRIAINIKDADNALRAVDMMASHFTIDPWARKSAILAKLAAGSKTAAEYEEFLARLRTAITQSANADRFDVAIPLAQKALEVARASRKGSLAREFLALQKRIGHLEASFKMAKSALDKLSIDPADKPSHTKLGMYYCFVKQDWEKGLKHLAQGDSPKLAKIATVESDTRDDKNALALGDSWWDAAQELDEGMQPLPSVAQSLGINGSCRR